MKYKERLIWFLCLMFFLTLMVLDKYNSIAGNNIYNNISLFSRVLNLIKYEYVEEVENKKLIYGAIDGMLESVDDPYTRFLKPEEFKEMKTETKGKFGGVGIYITIKDNWLTIIAPIEGTPAYRAGLQPYDKIIKINNESTEEISITEAVSKLRGKRKSKVTVTISRESIDKPFDVVLERDIIKVKSVVSQVITNSQIGYIKIKTFGQDTAGDLENVLRKYEGLELKGIIVDLRYNPGGLLEASWKVADHFLDKGKIVYTRGRIVEQNQEYFADSIDYCHDVPVVILIDEGTASASEIVTGALMDNKRAIVIGTKSFGKGVVQTVRSLDGKSAVALTTARYYTPSGRMIHDKGIKPDIVVEREEPSKKQLEEIQKLDESKKVEKFVVSNPEYNNKNIKQLYHELKKMGYDIEYKWLNKMVNIEGSRELNLYIDIENDTQLKRAIDVLEASNKM